MSARRGALIVALLIANLVHGLAAQEPGPAFGMSFSYSTSSIGPYAKPVPLSTLELEMLLPMHTAGDWGLEYAIELPIAWVRDNPRGTPQRYGGQWVVWNPPPVAFTTGVGIRPVGLRAWFGSAPVQLEAELSAGILRFETPLLADNATQVNFSGAAGVGIRVRMPRGARMVVGYRIHHASNAGFGQVNPGLDSYQIHMGLLLS